MKFNAEFAASLNLTTPPACGDKTAQSGLQKLEGQEADDQRHGISTVERSTLNVQRSTLNVQRSTLNAQRSTLNAQ
ncbi:MAG: hypothetical protein JXQ71_16535, partial [Verrucomicrobia bacterium]|nr:hypothetical protein [Verrucomicrobiota bacterium]